MDSHSAHDTAVNPHLALLHPYPFEKLRQLFAGVTPNAAYAPISLGIGEPKHPTPAFIQRALTHSLQGLANYPSTLGGEPLRRRSPTGWSAATACRRSTRPPRCCR